MMNTEHRPTVTIQLDVFLDEGPLGDIADPTPADVAREAWSSVGDWLSTGYQPVVTVAMPDGSTHDVDLEATL
jgi:hypothetical protein